jgi:hypothetical protein
MAKQLIINLPVKNTEISRKFFLDIGFTLNEQMTDENATCFEVGTDMLVAFLPEKHFKEATKKELADTTLVSEVLLSLGMESKDRVDALLESALSSGGTEFHEPMDLGSVYGRSFSDLDGHQWNIFFMKNK